VKRVTSSDPGVVEDPEGSDNTNTGGGTNTGGNTGGGNGGGNDDGDE